MRTAWALLTVLVFAAQRVTAQEPDLDTVLQRAAAYVAAYQKNLQGVVAEEVYYQNVISNRRTPSGRVSMVRDGRSLKSDVLMVKLGDDDWWMQFRDVFEVDRKPVRDRDQRLYKLFVDGKANARALAEQIQTESARYNIGPVMRTINIPIMALLFLEQVNQVSIEFKHKPDANTKRFSDLADPAHVWLIEFKEVGEKTMVKGRNNRFTPSHGRMWIDSRDGRVLRTELITDDVDLRAQIEVTYRAEEGLSLLVPGEMREFYNLRGGDARIDGRATYAKFRQFKVSTAEETKKPGQ